MSRGEQKNLVTNLAGDLGQVKNEETRYIMLSHFHKADADCGRDVNKAVKADIKRVEKLAAAAGVYCG